MEKENKEFNIYDKTAKMAAIAMMFTYLIYVLDHSFNILPSGNIWMSIIVNLMYYGPLTVVVLTSFDAVNKNHKPLDLLFCWYGLKQKSIMIG